MIGIVNYRLGNVQAFANIYKRANIPAEVVETPDQLRRVDRIILPGVGAFDWAMTRLSDSGLRGALDDAVCNDKKPVLGVCVGMQMMADSSDEGRLPGLGWIRARVRKFALDTSHQATPLPHMGWNDVQPTAGDSLFRDLECDARFYFLHSYYFEPDHPSQVSSVTSYGGEFASGVRSENVHGVQFHPEKSHHWGIQLLKNFAEA